MLNGQKIKRLIESLNTTKREFYETSGVSKNTVNNMVRGKTSPTCDNIEKIADYFRVPIDYFFDRNVEIPGKYIGHHVLGDGNKVSGDISFTINEYLREIEHLNDLLAEKQTIINEKERTINILLSQQNKEINTISTGR